MALHTPRRLGSFRPGQSLSTAASSPNLALSASAAIARKASLNALTGASPTTPGNNNMGGDGQEIDVGDTVDVPGGMHGVVRFIGSVRGKKGVFAGVELSREFASRGKNDGDVDGYAAQASSLLCLYLTLAQDALLYHFRPRFRHLLAHTQGSQAIFLCRILRELPSNAEYAIF